MRETTDFSFSCVVPARPSLHSFDRQTVFFAAAAAAEVAGATAASDSWRALRILVASVGRSTTETPMWPKLQAGGERGNGRTETREPLTGCTWSAGRKEDQHMLGSCRTQPQRTLMSLCSPPAITIPRSASAPMSAGG